MKILDQEEDLQVQADLDLQEVVFRCLNEKQELVRREAEEIHRVISDKASWKTLTVPEIQAIHKKLSAYKCRKVKEDLIDSTIDRCKYILQQNERQDKSSSLRQSYDLLKKDEITVKEFYQTLPSVLIPSQSVLISEDFSLVNEEFRQKISIADISRRRKVVTEYRQGVDLYSLSMIENIEDPHVDHIIERQLMAYCMATSDLGLLPSQQEGLCSPIRTVMNEVQNLNVTAAQLNIDKGNSFCQFIREDKQTGLPRPIHVLFFATTHGRERQIAQYTQNVVSTLQDTFTIVENELSELRREDNYVTGRQFQQIADRLAVLRGKTGIDSFDSRCPVTRSRAIKENCLDDI
eukprot:scaffold7567_cov167-Ochromonas_danica.AAC.13